MNRFLILASLVILLSPITALAQTDGPEFGVGLGVNYWFAQWDQDFFESSGGGLFGPKASVSFGRFGFGILYLTGDFDLDIEGSGGKIDADASRNDLDLVFQYSLLDYLGVSLGYKRLNYDYETETGTKAEETYDGFGLGVSGSYPLGESGFQVYGAASYLPLLNVDTEISTPGSGKITASDDADGLNLEIGAGYMFAALPLSIDLAYRYQKIESDEGASDEFGGPIIEIGYFL